MDVEKEKKTPRNIESCLIYSPYCFTACLRLKPAEVRIEKCAGLFTDLDGFGAFPKWYYGRHSSSRFKSYGVSKLKPFQIERNKKGCNTRMSREVTHPSTTLAQAHLTAEF